MTDGKEMELREGDDFAPVPADDTRMQVEAAKEIEAACILAKKFERDEQRAFVKIMNACDRYGFAENALYSFPRGGTKVEGPSIQMARTLAQAWGNVRWGTEVVSDTPSTRKIRVWAWDMETNTRVSAEDEFAKKVWRRGKGWVDILFDENGSDDERTLRELTYRKASLILRGCLLQLIPPDYVEAAVKACEATLRRGPDKEGGSHEDRVRALLTAFSRVGVSKDMIEKRLRHKLEALSPLEVAELRKVYKSIEDGQATVSEHFPSVELTSEPEAPPADDTMAGAPKTAKEKLVARVNELADDKEIGDVQMEAILQEQLDGVKSMEQYTEAELKRLVKAIEAM